MSLDRLDSLAFSYPLHSRSHRMRSENFYVKRDDELGFGVSGSKLRKYVSILPAIQKSSQTVALVGSMYSNHILSFLQLAKQEGISYRLFLERPRTKSLKGNAFFLSLLLKENEVIWIDKAPSVLSEDWTKAWEEKLGGKFFWIPVGGCMKEALLGSLTLASDIEKNEQELGVVFDHVFVDAGTGMSAIGLILGMAYLQKKCMVHVVLIAGTEQEFSEKLILYHRHLEELWIEEISLSTIKYDFKFPLTAKSFGSCNKSVLQEIKKTAENEGVFLDPMYTAKLLPVVRKTVEEDALEGNILWIHSGGGLSLAGFQEALSK